MGLAIVYNLAEGERRVRSDMQISRFGARKKIKKIPLLKKGVGSKIVELIHSKGAVTDDLSLLRIGYKEHKDTSALSSQSKDEAIILYESGKHNIDIGNIEKGISQLKESVALEPNFHEAVQLLSQFIFSEKKYEEAMFWIESYLKLKPDAINFWFYLSICAKNLRDFQKAIEAGDKVHQTQPFRSVNLINLADSYRMIGDFEKSRLYLNKAFKINARYESLQKLDQILKEKGYK